MSADSAQNIGDDCLPLKLFAVFKNKPCLYPLSELSLRNVREHVVQFCPWGMDRIPVMLFFIFACQVNP